MSDYKSQLKAAMARRDAALLRLGESGSQATLILRESISESNAFVAQQIHKMKSLVSSEIDHAGAVAGGQIEHAGHMLEIKVQKAAAKVDTQFQQWKSDLSPAHLIQNHPWEATIGAVVAGAMTGRAFDRSGKPPAGACTCHATPELPARENHSGGVRAQIMEALLANLPTLISLFFQRQSNEAQPSNSEIESISAND